MRKKIGALSIAILCLILLVACSGEEDKYVGEWKATMERTQEVESIGEISMTYNFELDVHKRHTYELQISKDEEATEELKTVVVDTLRDQLADTIEREEITEEKALENFVDEMGMEFEEYIDYVTASIESSFPPHLDDGDWELMEDYIQLMRGTEDKGKAKVDEKTLILEYGEDSLVFEKK